MKLFKNVDELVGYVKMSDEIYFDDMFGDNEDNVREVVKKNGNGFYCLEFGCRGEVDFDYVENFVDELVEWNSVKESENEFRYMRDDIGGDYLDLNFDEECIRCYFLIVEGK